MALHALRTGLWMVLFAAGLPGAGAAPAEVIDFEDLKPSCSFPFKFGDGTGVCEGDTDKLATLKTEGACKGPGLEWVGSACTAPAGRAKEFPKPDCGNRIPDLAYNAKAKNCHVVRETPRSAAGDFVGDCFKVVAVPSPNTLPYGVDDHVEVQSQRALASGDKELTVAPSERIALFGVSWLTIGCGKSKGPLTTVKASQLGEIGAHRYGYTFGVLTMPFKYYPGDKALTTGGLALGPYFGRRWGQPGSAVTLAVAATLGSVKGEVRDTSGNITATPDLTAFSVAAGLMWDVSKNPDVKAFKIGLFYGKDRVSNGDVVKFKQNGKPWFAFQIGYDFTDN